MSNQQNPTLADVVLTGTGTNPPLFEVTSQLSPDSTASEPVISAKPPKKPQVVFVGQKRTTKIIEIHVAPKAAAEESAMSNPADAAVEHIPSVPIIPPIDVAPVKTEGRFAVDPFVYEIDGPIPVMPTIPIVESKTSTDQVMARQQSGEHFAWRLMPTPYPSEGNVPQVPVTENGDFVEPAFLHTQPAEQWTETEVVAEDENCDHGDCFYAQSGDVIAIDGNKGFDHIDLRSYSINDATFQQGAILLHADPETADAAEGEQQPPPITIRHRGIDFAVFKGEVRVEL